MLYMAFKYFSDTILLLTVYNFEGFSNQNQNGKQSFEYIDIICKLTKCIHTNIAKNHSQDLVTSTEQITDVMALKSAITQSHYPRVVLLLISLMYTWEMTTYTTPYFIASCYYVQQL